jgi:hypothetical protein
MARSPLRRYFGPRTTAASMWNVESGSTPPNAGRHRAIRIDLMKTPLGFRCTQLMEARSSPLNRTGQLLISDSMAAGNA